MPAARMTTEEARIHLARLGLSQPGAARLFHLNPRTVRRFLAGDSEIPRAVEIALALLTPAKVRALLAEEAQAAAEPTNENR